MKPLVAITMGDPTGIGPEIIAKALVRPEIAATCRPVVLGDERAMIRAVEITGSPLAIVAVDHDHLADEYPVGTIPLLSVSRLADDDLHYGVPTAAGGDAVYRYICEAVRLCTSGKVSAMATAPINKEIMNRAGHHYPGHTELLAELTGSGDYVMMLAGERLRVALVTIHVALREVPALLTMERVLQAIRTTWRDTHRYFRPNPRLAVLSLNPHCGEGGMFGDEEKTVIAPAVEAARSEGIDAVGPLSADTLFHFAVGGEYDAVVCMYHDQGLIPLKLLHFDDGVNVTLGLPIIRTSVDHGTAYSLAGTGTASESSMVAAVIMAARMAGRNAAREAAASVQGR